MKPDQINIKIAEACGWRYGKCLCGCARPMWIFKDERLGVFEHALPDYLNDLNACHEMVAILDYEQAERFVDELRLIVERDERGVENPRPFDFAVIHATAAQRCESFLKTLGLWEETK